MQGDLISRSALIQQLREEGRLTYLIKGAIDNQPTTYDVEKVVASVEMLPTKEFLGVTFIPKTAAINMINRNGSCELPEPVPWDKLSGDYIRGYTKAIQDLHQIMLSIYDNFKRCKVRWSEGIIHEIFNITLAHRAEIREGTDGFIRWNVPLKKVEWYAPDIVRSDGKE